MGDVKKGSQAIGHGKFHVSATEYKPRRKLSPCPAPKPLWVSSLVTSGSDLFLDSLVMQAGRHFSDSFNMDVGDGTSTRRQQATGLAWLLISMIRPRVVNDGNHDRLVVGPTKDKDIKRLAAEILGVGASLELLRSLKVIDARTLKKVSGRFDFEARERGGKGVIAIEAKGTHAMASLEHQRTSFAKKLRSAGLLQAGAPRGYSRAIGIVFGLWEDAVDRGHDVQILDPDGECSESSEQAVRDVIAYYARTLDECAGLLEGAKALMKLAKCASSLSKEVVSKQLGQQFNNGGVFNRASFSFPVEYRPGYLTDFATFWGGFWDVSWRPAMWSWQDMGLRCSPVATYTGYDSKIIELIRNVDFEGLLNYQVCPKQWKFDSDEGFKGYFVLTEDGVIRGWIDKFPDQDSREVRRLTHD